MLDYHLQYEYIATENELKTSEYKKRLRTGTALNTLLKGWRTMYF